MEMVERYSCYQIPPRQKPVEIATFNSIGERGLQAADSLKALLMNGIATYLLKAQ